MLVLFALLAAVSADHGHGVEDEKTEELVKSLRKQLIENNYDYMSKENGGDVINMRAQDDDVTQRSSTKHANNTVKEEVNLIFLKRQRVTSNRVTINTAHTTHRAHSADPDADVSKHDLLYYVDDRHFISKSAQTQVSSKRRWAPHPRGGRRGRRDREPGRRTRAGAQAAALPQAVHARPRRGRPRRR